MYNFTKLQSGQGDMADESIEIFIEKVPEYVFYMLLLKAITKTW